MHARSLVDRVVNWITPLTSSRDIEVQERAAETLQLFNFIRADLTSYRPYPATASEGSSAEPRFPKSLYLLQPLSGAHPFGPVAPSAQEKVHVPEGLDLDAWIVPPPLEPEDVRDSVRKVKKGKEKEKTKDGVKSKGKKKGRNGDIAVVEDQQPMETEEERLVRERVRFLKRCLLLATC